MEKPKRILVTGAAGFIGMHQALRLLQAGHRVLGLDNLNPYYDPALKAARLTLLKNHPNFQFERVSLEDEATVMPIIAAFRPEIIVHFAAQAGVRHSLKAPREFTRSNIEGFLTILEAARANPVEHLVYASSSSVYGTNTKVPFSEDDPVDHPISLYAATKRANELMAETYAHLHRIPLTGLRFFTVYGPSGRPDMAMWSFTAAIHAGEPIEVYDEAHMSRDFTYVDDVVEAIERLLPLPPAPGPTGAPHRILNIGNNHPEKLSDFIAAIEAACGRKAIKLHRPRQSTDVETTYADVTRLAALTGFRPKTSIAEGARLFAEWYRGWIARRT